MKAYSLIVIFAFICCICEYTSIDIMHEFKKNILNFGYRINFNYGRMPVHSIDTLYEVTKFVLPTMEDLELSPIEIDSTCNYLNVYVNKNQFPNQFILNFKNYCKKITSFIDFYKKQIDSQKHST